MHEYGETSRKTRRCYRLWHLPWPGCSEEHCVSISGDVLKNFLDLWLEAHVQHSVSFIQHLAATKLQGCSMLYSKRLEPFEKLDIPIQATSFRTRLTS